MLIVEQVAAHEELLGGEGEVDESYFSNARKGKRGRGAVGKVPVFSLLKRDGKIFSIPVPDAEATTLMPIITRLAEIQRHSKAELFLVHQGMRV
ncbi:putative transposase [Brucella grignonensis]|uniref:Putative transposase n=1 Tax=Brucella grignonensis TaxID=94627 RepID=A0A256FC44_9HYPH|nr:putative transposase [Brucella grignonensis]